jgi:hypothetical protein
MVELHYLTIDHHYVIRKYKSIKNARRFAHRMMGEFPDIGLGYAVSNDGVGTLRCYGCKMADLFGGGEDERQAD